MVENCYNLGSKSNASELIVTGAYCIGGLFGTCSTCSVSKSGILSVQIYALYTYAGALFGELIDPLFVSECYASSLVSVTSPEGSAGGIAGNLQFTQSFNNLINNIHSKASVNGLTTNTFCGSFSPYIKMLTNTAKFTIYFASPIKCSPRCNITLSGSGSFLFSTSPKFIFSSSPLLLSFSLSTARKPPFHLPSTALRYTHPFVTTSVRVFGEEKDVEMNVN